MTRHKRLMRLARTFPSIVLEQPWAIFIKVLCMVSGLTSLLGPAPGAVEAALPRGVAVAWGVTLILGAGTGLYGMLWVREPRLEIAGLIWLGTAALVYAVTLFIGLGIGAAISGMIVGAFAVAALVRALAVYVTYEIARQHAGGNRQ